MTSRVEQAATCRRGVLLAVMLLSALSAPMLGAATSAEAGAEADFAVNTAPAVPTARAQLKADGTTGIPLGGTVPPSTVVFRGMVSDPDAGQTVRLQVEVKPLGTPFTGAVSCESGLVAGGTAATCPVTGLAPARYHWRLRAMDSLGAPSAWASYATNAETAADFAVNTVPAVPTARAQLRADGTTGIPLGGTVPPQTLVFRGTVSDPDVGQNVRLQVEVKPVGSAFTGTVSCYSGLVSGGTATTCQVTGLAPGRYNWRLRAMDSLGTTSAWVSYATNAETAADFVVNTSPNPPTGHGQFDADGTTAIPLGGTVTSTTVVFRGTVSDPDAGQGVRLQVEVKPVGTAFTGPPSCTSEAVPSNTAAGCQVTLTAGTSYHWQARTVDNLGRPGPWGSYGDNAEETTDFTSGMGWGLVGETSSHADNGTSTTATPSVDISSLNPEAGDVIVLVACRRGTTSISGGISAPKFVVTTAGGQAWNALPPSGTMDATMNVFIARYTGGGTSYAVTDRSGGTLPSTLYAQVWRPAAPSRFFRIWAEQQTAFAAGTTPSTRSIAAWTTAPKHGSDSHLNLAFWLSTDVSTWGSVSGTGWDKAGLSAQIRNVSGSGMSLTAAYNIQASSGTTDAVSQDQTASGGGEGCTFRFTLTEFDLPAGPDTGAISVPPSETAVNSPFSYTGTALSVTLTAPVPTGSAVIGYWRLEDFDGGTTGGRVVDITDDQGNEYLILHRIHQRDLNQESIVFARWNITNGPQTITCNVSRERIAQGVIVHVVPGIAGLDMVAGGDHVEVNAYSPEDFVLPQITPSVDGCYLFFGVHLPGQTADIPFFTFASPFVKRVEHGNEADPLIPNVATADALQESAAPVTPTVTMAGGRMAMGIAAAFKPVVAGGQTASDGSP